MVDNSTRIDNLDGGESPLRFQGVFMKKLSTSSGDKKRASNNPIERTTIKKNRTNFVNLEFNVDCKIILCLIPTPKNYLPLSRNRYHL